MKSVPSPILVLSDHSGTIVEALVWDPFREGWWSVRGQIYVGEGNIRLGQVCRENLDTLRDDLCL
jgi:hypothetical protein